MRFPHLIAVALAAIFISAASDKKNISKRQNIAPISSGLGGHGDGDKRTSSTGRQSGRDVESSSRYYPSSQPAHSSSDQVNHSPMDFLGEMDKPYGTSGSSRSGGSGPPNQSKSSRVYDVPVDLGDFDMSLLPVLHRPSASTRTGGSSRSETQKSRDKEKEKRDKEKGKRDVDDDMDTTNWDPPKSTWEYRRVYSNEAARRREELDSIRFALEPPDRFTPRVPQFNFTYPQATTPGNRSAESSPGSTGTVVKASDWPPPSGQSDRGSPSTPNAASYNRGNSSSQSSSNSSGYGSGSGSYVPGSYGQPRPTAVATFLRISALPVSTPTVIRVLRVDGLSTATLALHPPAATASDFFYDSGYYDDGEPSGSRHGMFHMDEDAAKYQALIDRKRDAARNRPYGSAGSSRSGSPASFSSQVRAAKRPEVQIPKYEGPVEMTAPAGAGTRDLFEMSTPFILLRKYNITAGSSGSSLAGSFTRDHVYDDPFAIRRNSPRPATVSSHRSSSSKSGDPKGKGNVHPVPGRQLARPVPRHEPYDKLITPPSSWAEGYPELQDQGGHMASYQGYLNFGSSSRYSVTNTSNTHQGHNGAGHPRPSATLTLRHGTSTPTSRVRRDVLSPSPTLMLRLRTSTPIRPVPDLGGQAAPPLTLRPTSASMPTATAKQSSFRSTTTLTLRLTPPASTPASVSASLPGFFEPRRHWAPVSAPPARNSRWLRFFGVGLSPP